MSFSRLWGERGGGGGGGGTAESANPLSIGTFGGEERAELRYPKPSYSAAAMHRHYCITKTKEFWNVFP